MLSATGQQQDLLPWLKQVSMPRLAHPEPHTLHLSTRGSPFMGMNALCSWSFMSLHNMISLLLSRFFCLFVCFVFSLLFQGMWFSTFL